MKRCKQCILPETFPGIIFDMDGVCNYCLEYEPIKVLGERELEKVLSKYRNKGDEYDCIAPISGGRDSAFVLHQVVKKYGMRTLALTVDNGCILPEGIRNIKRETEVLNVPHVWLRDEKKTEIAKRNTGIKFRGWIGNPSINTIVPVLNSGDKTMNIQMSNYAKENNIPLVLGGNIVGTATIEHDHWKTGFLGIFPNEHGIYSTFDKIKLVFLLGFESLKNPYNYRPSILKEYIVGASAYFYESLFRPKGVTMLGFYDYVYWDEKVIVSTITDELDWKGASDATTTWRIDDSAYPLVNYLLYKLVGFTDHDEMYSKMIREKQLSREEAMERCLIDHKSPWIHGSRLLTSLKELEVTKGEVDEAIEIYREELLGKILRKSRN